MSTSDLSRLGVMGGTFDPIHLGHLVVATEARDAFDLDRVLFVPAGRPWQREDYASAEDRFTMTVLGTDQDPAFAVSRMEIDRRGPTYTADTLQELRGVHPGTELSFIAGADAVLGLGTWIGLERIRDLAGIIAVNRPGSDLSELEPEPGWPRVDLLEIPAIEISATDIRQRVRSERPIDHLVPAQVAAYIKERGLYLGGSHD